MDGPLILDAKAELLFFKTASDLERWVEAIDLENNEYGDCWDSSGQLRRLRAERRPLLGGWLGSRELVRVDHPTPPDHETDLRRALVKFLASVDESESALVTLSTAELIARGVQHAGWR